MAALGRPIGRRFPVRAHLRGVMFAQIFLLKKLLLEFSTGGVSGALVPLYAVTLVDGFVLPFAPRFHYPHLFGGGDVSF